MLVYRNILNKNLNRFGSFLRDFSQTDDNILYIFSQQKRDFYNYISNHKSIIICSHGSQDCIYHRLYNNTQSEHQVLFSENNISYLNNKVVIALSCSTAHTLGKLAVENGCLAYLGFQRRIHFERKTLGTSRRFHDLIRKCYIDVFSRVLEITKTKELTVGQMSMLLKHELAVESKEICMNYAKEYPIFYQKYYINEIITTVANVSSNIVVHGNNKEIIVI